MTCPPQLSAATASREESASVIEQAATDRDADVRSSEEAGRDLQRALDECQSLRGEADAAAARLQQIGEEVADARKEAGRAQAAREVMLQFSPIESPS